MMPINRWLPAPRHSRSAASALVLAVLLALSPPPPLHGQVSGSVGAGAHFQHFGFSDADATGIRSVHLLTMPVAARIDLGRGVSMDVGSAWARAGMQRSRGPAVTLSGPTDTQLRLGWSTPGSGLHVTMIGVLPSGTASFSADEADLAGVVAADLLPFRVSHWGAGGGAGGALAMARTAGPWGVAGSAAFLVPGSFEPLDSPAFDYRPGAHVAVRAAVDRRVGAAARASLALSHHRHGDDAADRENLFRAGDRTQALASLAFPAGATGSAVVYGGYLHRDRGTFLLTDQERTSQGFILVGAGLRHPTALGTLVPSGDLRVVRRESGENQGWIMALGASLERRAGQVNWAPTLVGRLGNVQARTGVNTGVIGLEAGARVTFGGGR
jgi:hypothetical protein